MPSVAQGEDIALVAIYYDEFGAPADATTPLVDILDPAGVAVVTDAVPTHDGVGQYHYTYSVAADAEISALWKARWTGTVDGVEVGPIEEFFEVTEGGDHYFTIAEAKALPGMSAIADADIVEARDRIEQLIEKKADMAFVPRTRTVTISGRGSNRLVLGDWFIRSISAVAVRDLAVSTNYDATALADLGFGSREVYRKSGTVFPWGAQNITVTYSYGMAEPPEPVKRAALLMCQANFNLVDAEGNQQGHEQVLLDIPEVEQLLEPYVFKNSVHSIQIGTG